jgi:phage-related minor tail protein
MFGRAGNITSFAGGGLFDKPTPFTYGGGKPGVLGEAGTEVVAPVGRGADGRIGLKMEGYGNSTVNNYNFSISTPNAESFRRSEGQIGLKIAAVVSSGSRFR